MPRPLRQIWQHTWLHGGADFLARTDGGFLRVYKKNGINDPGTEWFWAASRRGVLGKGLTGRKREACEKAEDAWFATNVP